MTDGFARPLGLLKAAANPLRLGLLQLAAEQGEVHSGDARRLAAQGQTSGSGGPQWHVGELEKADLIRRKRHGVYELTKVGESLVAALDLRARDAPGEVDGTNSALVRHGEVTIEGEAAPNLLPAGAELVAVLTQSVKGRQASTTIRIRG